MHRTEGPDVEVVSGKNFYKQTTPGTVVNKRAMNALQEEIATTIELAGYSLRTAANDEANEYGGQLHTAIKTISYQEFIQGFWPIVNRLDKPLIGCLPETYNDPSDVEVTFLKFDDKYKNTCSWEGVDGYFTYPTGFTKKIIDNNGANFPQEMFAFQPGSGNGCCAVEDNTNQPYIETNAYSPVFALHNMENGQQDVCIGLESQPFHEYLKNAVLLSGWISDITKLKLRLIGYIYVAQNLLDYTFQPLHHQPDGWVNINDGKLFYPSTPGNGVNNWRPIQFALNSVPAGTFEVFRDDTRKYHIILQRVIGDQAGEVLRLRSQYPDNTVPFKGQGTMYYNHSFKGISDDYITHDIELNGYNNWEFQADSECSITMTVDSFYIDRSI